MKWVTAPSRFSATGKKHNMGCRYYGKGHGGYMAPENVPADIVQCKVCAEL